MLEKNNVIKYYPINKFTNAFFNEPKDKYPICLKKTLCMHIWSKNDNC